MYLQANAAERLEGALWYSRALSICTLMATQFSRNTELVVGVVSLLSPRNEWHRNITDAENLIAAYIGGCSEPGDIKCCTFNSNKEKAWQLLELGTVNHSLFGRKQFSFFRNILGDSSVVTVDGHAYHIWLGVYAPISKARTISAKLYSNITTDYQTVANLLGLEAHQLQATTWLTYKRLRGV